MFGKKKSLVLILKITILFVVFSCTKRDDLDSARVFEFLNAKDLGVDFQNTLTYTEEFNTYLYRSFYNGAGVGLADLNNDGFLDLFFCGNQVSNALYLGDGDFNFKNVTKIAGVQSDNAWSTGVSVVDIDQDGWLDIYICKSGNPNDVNRRNELFINQGVNSNGVPIFKEEAKKYGLDNLGFSIHAQFFDYDLDGDWDMYLSNNSIKPSEVVIDANKGMREKLDEGGGDKLFRNDHGFFNDVTRESGVYSSPIGYGLGIAVSDVNRDGWPDIYVANDFFEKDYLYINNRDGTFKESSAELFGELSLGSMGVDIMDMNHDGYPEIFVTEMLPDDEGRLKTKALFDDWDRYQLKERNGYHKQFPRNMFHLNNGENKGNISFSDISRYAGVAATDWSWGVLMADFNLDGNNEIFVTNGIAKDLLDQDYIDFYKDPSKVRQILRQKGAVIKELIDNIPSEPISNYMYLQTEDMKYDNKAAEWGLGQLGFSNGAAYGDIDNDGDLDLVVNNIDAPPYIYKNNVSHDKKHFLSVRAENRKGTTAVGANVTVTVGGKKYFQEIFPMRGAMSVVDDRLLFGLGTAQKIDTLQINWANGVKQVKTDLKTDQFLKYIEPYGDSIDKEEDEVFLDNMTWLGGAKGKKNWEYRHVENDFVDFDRERLLYHMVSNEGPKLAVGDINGDGRDDFFIGGSKGYPGTLFVQQKNGEFKETNKELFEKDKLSEDLGALFFDADNDGDVDLLVASGGMEFSDNSYALMDRLYSNDGSGNFIKSTQVLPGQRPLSTSKIINLDYDGDGDEDLFFAGRLRPSAYGVPVSSYLLENDGQGNFKDITLENAPGLKNLGMATDAVAIDYDKDGDQDLAVAGEWMPIRIFSNDSGQFREVTKQLGLDEFSGFWYALTKADLDEDGYEELIAGNLGENTFFKASPEEPVQMYVNDFDNNGKIEQVITTYHGEKSYPVAQKKEIMAQMPHISKKYLKYADYKEKTIEEIFDNEELENAVAHTISTNKSMVFWNKKGSFKGEQLPKEAQLTPIYSILVEDLDGNGLDEIILGGNQYRAKPQTGIYGANYGTVLEVLPNRTIRAVDHKKSGFYIKGEVRDIKKIKIQEMSHLIVTRSNDYAKIFSIDASNQGEHE